MFREYISDTPALAAGPDRVSIYASAAATTTPLGIITATPVRPDPQTPWMYRIQQPIHAQNAEHAHAGELYYAERRGPDAALRLDNPVSPEHVPQFLYAAPGDYWAAQRQQEYLVAQQCP